MQISLADIKILIYNTKIEEHIHTIPFINMYIFRKRIQPRIIFIKLIKFEISKVP